RSSRCPFSCSSLYSPSAAGGRCPNKATGTETSSWPREKSFCRFRCFWIFAPRNRRDTFLSAKRKRQSRRSRGKGIPWHLHFPNTERKCTGHGTALNGAELTLAVAGPRQQR